MRRHLAVSSRCALWLGARQTPALRGNRGVGAKFLWGGKRVGLLSLTRWPDHSSEVNFSA
jgi:hypothetical protein